jgi:ABC-2 type transport system ATP-binding protein
MNIVETSELGRRFGSKWALSDCTISIPEGHLVALVGPNGAGKSTLLNIIVGLTLPSTGSAAVLGGEPAGSLAALSGIAFVAQDMSLYRSLSVGDMLHLARNLNHYFDGAYARSRLADLGIADRHKTGKLSGGQQAQLALTVALARRPRLLVLDEPTASLDPVARHDFMAAVVTAMAEEGVSVVLSSHIIAELERVADYLVLMSNGHVRLDGPVDEILSSHRLLTGPASRVDDIHDEVIEASAAGQQAHRLVRIDINDFTIPSGFESRGVGLEELTLAYLRESAHSTPLTLTGASQ